MTKKIRRGTKQSSADKSVRSVDKLGIFGITDMWRVAAILPREYWDYSAPNVELQKLSSGDCLCIGGVASECRQIAGSLGELDSGQVDDDLDEADEDGVFEFESLEDGEDGPGSPARKVQNKWSFVLTGRNGISSVRVEISAITKAHSALAATALKGEAVYVYGHLSRDEDGRLVMRDAEPVDVGSTGRIHARYPSKSRKVLEAVAKPKRKPAAKAVKQVKKRATAPKWKLKKLTPENVSALVQERLRLSIHRAGTTLRDRLGLKKAQKEWDLMRVLESPTPTIEGLFWQAHQPRTIEEGMRAVRVLEKLTALEMLKRIEDDRAALLNPSSALKISPEHYRWALDEMFRNTGIRPTEEQDLAIRTTLVDIMSDYRMNRLVSGDVGTGKTIVFVVAAAAVYAAGGLAVILEARTNLVNQVYRLVRKYWPGIPAVLITGGATDVEVPSAGILVGTTGVWKWVIESGYKPALLIADEQQKLGVRQRTPWELTDVNLLEATATAIPRTQGLLECGGMDVSTLRMQRVAKDIKTIVAKSAVELQAVHKEVCERIKSEGKNLILVFPRIDKKRSDDADADDELAQTPGMQAVAGDTPMSVEEGIAIFSDMFQTQIGVMHGRMVEEHNDAVLLSFDAREIKVLIATSIIEVGVDFKVADQMIIYRPELFGVSAVHQLRGRLARQGGKGWCYLACGSGISSDQMEIMQAMTTENDGFKLATRDMIRRGIGDIRQHAKQQSGEYMGFLVDRPPKVEDIVEVAETCARWLRDGSVDSDMFSQDKGKHGVIDSLGKVAAKPKRMRAATKAASTVDGVEDESLMVAGRARLQQDMFGTGDGDV